jgi:hypothetical protein
VQTESARRYFDAPVMPVESLTAEAITDHRLLAIDADLTSVSVVRLLRRALRGRREGYFHAFAINPARRLETVHATVIGASALLSPFDPEERSARIAEFERSQAGASVGTPDSIAGAAVALGDLFAAITAGGAVQLPTVVSASSGIVDEIGSLGYATGSTRSAGITKARSSTA